MTRPFLSIDLGNSRLKACVFDGAGEPQRSTELGLDRALGAAFTDFLGSGVQPLAAGGCSVAHRRWRDDLDALLRDVLPSPVRWTPPHGLRLAVDSPETIGADRLYAARGALECVGGAAVVVDAGTALTVDAVQATEGEDARALRGTFLGGAIAPGPRLLARALGEGAAQLHEVDPRPGRPALGRDTRSALEAGVVVGFEGAALRLVERVAAESGIDGPVVLTGGARAFLEAVLGEAYPLRIEPHLVHFGLRSACGDPP